MDNKNLKIIFGNIAKENDYKTGVGIWYKETEECILTLSLQKSNYGNCFYLNIKLFIKGIFGTEYKIDKTLKNDTGDIFRRSPSSYDKYFNFDVDLSDDERIKGLEMLFADFINPFAKRALRKDGILELEWQEEITILPAVKTELEKIVK